MRLHQNYLPRFRERIQFSCLSRSI
jgi:hypothetical protein